MIDKVLKRKKVHRKNKELIQSLEKAVEIKKIWFQN